MSEILRSGQSNSTNIKKIVILFMLVNSFQNSLTDGL